MRRTRLAVASLMIAVAATAGALVHSQAQTTDMPKGTNVLLGRVLDSRADAPVAGAVVTLSGTFDPSGHALPPPQTGRDAGAAARSAITNGDGYFVFRDLPEAQYSITAGAFGYAATSALRTVNVYKSDRPVSMQLHMEKFAAISGAVLDDRGEPLAGIPVVALRRTMLAGSLALRSAASAQTDDRGIYRLAQLAPGGYIVGVLSATTSLPVSVADAVEPAAQSRYVGAPMTDLLPTGITISTGEGVRVGDVVLQRTGPAPPPASDGKMWEYATTFAPGTPVPTDAGVITIGSGDQRTVADLALRLSPTVRVSGIANGPAGPVKNLALRLLAPGAVDTADLQPAGALTAITDAGGAFTFPAVIPGSYNLKASIAETTRLGDTTTDISLWTRQPVAVPDTDVVGLTVAMKPGIRVSGRIEFKGASDSPRTDAQKVVLVMHPIGAQSWRSLSAFAGPDGSFTTPGDPAGRYTLYTQPPPGWTWQTLTRDGKVVMDDVIDLENSDLSGFVIAFSRQSNHVTGAIADAGTAESDVILFPADSTLWREGIINTRRFRVVPTTSAGAFDVSGLAPGDYYIAAIGARFAADATDPLFLARLIPGATKFTLGEGDSKTLQLKTFVPKEK